MTSELILDLEEVEGSKGWLVVVAQIVQSDGLSGRRGDGDDRGTRIVCSEPRRLKVELALRIGRPGVPQLDRVVQACRHELIVVGAQIQARDATLVALEVANEGVVVHGEIADVIVVLGGGVDDGGTVVGEAGQSAAIFLRLELFRVLAGLDVEQLHRVVGAR